MQTPQEDKDLNKKTKALDQAKEEMANKEITSALTAALEAVMNTKTGQHEEDQRKDELETKQHK